MIAKLAFQFGLALGLGASSGCGQRVSREYVFPTGYVGPYYLVISDTQNTTKQLPGGLCTTFDGNGIGYISRKDTNIFSGWGSDSYSFSNGTKIVTMTPGTHANGPWAETQGFTSEGRRVDVNGRPVTVQIEYYVGYIGNGVKTEK